MRSIEVLGAGGGEVTGSAYKLTGNNGTEILIDCGMHQGLGSETRNQNLKKYELKNIKAAVISHAHLDHIGGVPACLPKLDVPIYMTPATCNIGRITLNNAQSLSPELYSQDDVDSVLKRFIRVPYDTSIRVDGMKLTFKDAGHMLGSSSVILQEDNGETVVFSGDLGRKLPRTVRPGKHIKQADIVVMESTYGDRSHPDEDPIDVVKEAIKIIKRNKGTLLIPTFAIDRTQVMVNLLKKLKEDGTLGKIPVFLDGPMGIDVTKEYSNHRELLNIDLRNQKTPFNFDGLIKTYKSEDSKAISNYHGAKIIIAGSGMMNGGRIKNHAANYLPKENSVLLLVGYPAEGTPSRAIAEGEKEVLIGDEVIPVEATVFQTSALSAHADMNELSDWAGDVIRGGKIVRKFILGHGSDSAREKLAHRIIRLHGIESVALPNNGEKIDLQ